MVGNDNHPCPPQGQQESRNNGQQVELTADDTGSLDYLNTPSIPNTQNEAQAPDAGNENKMNIINDASDQIDLSTLENVPNKWTQ